MGELSFRLSERARREWRILPLQELLLTPKKALISGPFGSNISSKYFVEDGVPVIRGNNLSANVGTRFIDEGFVFLTQEKADELGTWAVTGDIVLTAAGTIGQIGIISERLKHKSYIISNKQIRARLNQDIVDLLFCYYWLSTDYMREVIESSNTGSTIPLINLTVVRGLEFPVPEKPEQEAIVEVLSSLDDKIDLLHRQNKTLESLAETLFRHWFIDGAQDDWEMGTLGDLIELRYGKALKDSERSGSGFPVVGSSGIVGYHSQALVKGPGLVTGRKGTLGVATYLETDFHPIDTTFYVVPKRRAKLGFAYFLLKTLDFKELNTDSAVPGLNRDIAHGLERILPPEDLIEHFRAVFLKKESSVFPNQV